MKKEISMSSVPEASVSGVLPNQSILQMIKHEEIGAANPIEASQIQPASLDLRLGDEAYRVRASFLPGADKTVTSVLDDLTMHRIDLRSGAVLERGCVYIVPIQESLALPDDVQAIANPKSSTGRLDVFTRLITDNATTFDAAVEGYNGPLFIEIAPCTFSILARTGDRLNQLRLCRGRRIYSEAELMDIHQATPLVQSDSVSVSFDRGIAFSVDLDGDSGRAVGYRARLHAPVVDLAKINHYDPKDFWEPIYSPENQGLILNPGDFYILASRESLIVPPDHAAEMVAYDTLVGEFRAHYAGFFDPGFGWAAAGGSGSKAVLEVRSHDVPFLLGHGQTVGRLVYEQLSERPTEIYGASLKSNYQKQQLKLGKHFKDWDASPG